MLIGTQSSPLTISTLTANDIFLYWYSTCENGNLSSTDSHKAQKFKIAPGIQFMTPKYYFKYLYSMFFIIPFTLYIQAQQFTTIQEQIFVNSDSIQPFLLN
jgi:hypothetical protein